MSEFDPLRPVLREWQTPAPSEALDARVRARFRAVTAPSPWKRFWEARVSVPVPALAALVAVLAVVWMVEFRPAAPPAPRPAGIVTRLEAAGFQPVPDGVARVEEVRQ